MDMSNIAENEQDYEQFEHISHGRLPTNHRRPNAKPRDPERGAMGKPAGGLAWLDWEALMNMPKPKWLVDGLMQKGVNCLYAKENVGKSFLACDFGLSIVTGRPWFGRQVEQGPVVYICGEGAGDFATRVKSWVSRYGSGLESEVQKGFRVIPQPVDMRAKETVAELERKMRGSFADPRMVVVDTLNRCFGAGDENSGKDMNEFVAACDRLRASFPDCSLLVLHHPGKDEKKGPRGHSSFPGALETSMHLRRSVASDNRHLALHCHKMKGVGEPFAPISLGLVNAGDSLVVEQGKVIGEVCTTKKKKVLPAKPKAVFDALKEGGPADWSSLLERAKVAGSTLGDALNVLKDRGLVWQDADGLYAVVPAAAGNA